MTALKSRLQEALDDLTNSQENDGQLRSQLLNLENEARELENKVSAKEEEMTGLRHQLAQRTQELASKVENASATLAQKNGAIQTLEADLERSVADLKIATQKAHDLEDRLAEQIATTHSLEAGLDQLRKDGEEKDAVNDELDDKRFDAEVALANDRRALQIVQQSLIERSQETEARLRHNEDLLTASLAQLANEREHYRLILSTKPEAEFLLLRVLTYEGTQIRMRDRILSPSGADELLEQLEQASHDLSKYIFLTGMNRRSLSPEEASYSSIRLLWREQQVLWVVPTASYAGLPISWTAGYDSAKDSNLTAMAELEREGFTLDAEGGKLVYSGREAEQSLYNQRKRKRTTQWPGVYARHRRADRSQSPRRDRRAGSRFRSRSRGRGITDPARLTVFPGSHGATAATSSAQELMENSQASRLAIDVVGDEENTQTAGRIEDAMENE